MTPLNFVKEAVEATLAELNICPRDAADEHEPPRLRQESPSDGVGFTITPRAALRPQRRGEELGY